MGAYTETIGWSLNYGWSFYSSLHGAENFGAQGKNMQGSHDSYGQGVFPGTMTLVIDHHHVYCGSM